MLVFLFNRPTSLGFLFSQDPITGLVAPKWYLKEDDSKFLMELGWIVASRLPPMYA